MSKARAVLARALAAGVLSLALAVPALAATLTIEVEGEANGTIVIELFDDVAPQHAERIRALAEAGAYDGVVFHRVIDGFMAQTGDVEFGRLGMDMRQAGRGGSSLPDLPAEFSDRSFTRGTVGMARSGDPRCYGVPGCTERPEFLNSANSQFFITFGRAPHLDGLYTAVGRVVEGMEVVDAIKRGRGRNGEVFGRPDVMVRVSVSD